MKVKENVTVYQCEHCDKKLFRKHAMENHEMMCYHNPDNFRPCYGCVFLGKKKVQVNTNYPNPWGGDMFMDKELFYCHKKETFLHSPQVEMKGNAIDQENIEDEVENNPMPISCEMYKQNNI